MTNLSEWTTDGAAEYLALCEQRYIGDNRHHVFAFRQGNYDILVPAVLFIKALFPPSSITFRSIFAPGGLARICTPTLEGAAADVVLSGVRMRSVVKDTQAKKDIFRWVSFFPSATRAWASVYQFATKGRCSITLPDAEATIAFSGRLTERKLLVSAMTITKVRTLEAPLEWTGEQSSEILYRREKPSGLYSPLRIQTVPEGKVAGPMTDAEWAAVEHLFLPARGGISPERRRAALDAIVEKLSTGTGWKLANWRAGMPSGVAESYHVLHRNGKWAKFEEILRSMREAT